MTRRVKSGEEAVKLIAELRSAAAAMDLDPAALAVELAKDAPVAPIAPLEEALNSLLRSEPVFANEEQLYGFYQEMGKRILARLLLLTERTLLRLAQKIDASPLDDLSFTRLMALLQTFEPYITALREKQRPPSPPQTSDEVEAELARARKELEDLRGEQR